MQPRSNILVLVVDDDSRILRLVRVNLERAGFEVDTASNGVAALDQFDARPPDAVVLDVTMPGIDGFTLTRRIREISSVPIILLTAIGEQSQKVKGLDIGADDYLTKPFDPDELVARLRALLRRRVAGAPAVLRVGDLEMDPATRDVRREGQQVELTPKEFALLEFLMRNADRPLSRATLMEHVWGIRFDPGTNIVDVCVNSLRNKLQDRDRELIQTV
ncbi:MAG TPA: response regulator transcription factor, partial [Chloroflexia bacterium]